MILLVTTLLLGQLATDTSMEDAPPSRVGELPRWGFELRAGPYQPDIGSAEEKAFYDRIYASGKDDSLFKYRPLLKQVELDYYVFNKVGLVGIYGRFGQWRTEGPTRVCSEPSAGDPDTTVVVGCTSDTVDGSTPGNDTTTLSVLTFSAGLVYRFDLVKRLTPIPFVPYAKAGLDYYFWRNTVGGKVSKSGKTRGEGATLGFDGAVGLSFNLDWIEPDAAARARSGIGMADSYIFAEASRLFIDGFGETARLDMSGTVVQVGLAVDFL